MLEAVNTAAADTERIQSGYRTDTERIQSGYRADTLSTALFTASSLRHRLCRLYRLYRLYRLHRLYRLY